MEKLLRKNWFMACIACLFATVMFISCDKDSDNAEKQLSDYIYTGVPGKEGGYRVIEITDAPEIAEEKGWPIKHEPILFEGVTIPDSVFPSGSTDINESISFHFRILSVRDTVTYSGGITTHDWVPPRHFCVIKMTK